MEKSTEIPGKKLHLAQKTPFIILFCFICCFLWGSAFPCVKVGYSLFQIGANDTASQLLFAGTRFTLAGVLVVIIGSIAGKKLLLPKKSSWKNIGVLAIVQTVIQYLFFYIGLAHTSGVKSSIIEAASTFFAILMAALVFRYEKLTAQKIIGCLVGFAGVIIINMAGSSFELSFSLTGEGFILISALSYALSSALLKRYSKDENPVTLSGYQFILGGIVLIIIGAASGGSLVVQGPENILLLLYMASISAVAYSLWGILLKYNPVSKIAMFGFMNPVIGVILSAIILNEQNQAFSLYGLVALVLISIGIITVYRQKN